MRTHQERELTAHEGLPGVPRTVTLYLPGVERDFSPPTFSSVLRAKPILGPREGLSID